MPESLPTKPPRAELAAERDPPGPTCPPQGPPDHPMVHLPAPGPACLLQDPSPRPLAQVPRPRACLSAPGSPPHGPPAHPMAHLPTSGPSCSPQGPPAHPRAAALPPCVALAPLPPVGRRACGLHSQTSFQVTPRVPVGGPRLPGGCMQRKSNLSPPPPTTQDLHWAPYRSQHFLTLPMGFYSLMGEEILVCPHI